MNSEIISLETFQKMWNGETYIEHNQMVDALDDKSVWEFVLDETTNGSTKVFEFFTEAEMPSKSAFVQLMNTVPNELFGLNAEELKERIGENNNFVNFAIVYYVLLEKMETPEFYKYNVGEMYYDGFKQDSAFVTYLKCNYWFGVLGVAMMIIAFVVGKYTAPVLYIALVVGLVALLIWILRK